MNVKCCIIDDEPLARELIKSYVEKTPFLQLMGCFESATDAIKLIISGTLDVIFLDVNMPCLNGIELAEIIPQSCRIVYITAYEKYALQSYKVNALDYLLKPVDYTDFVRAANKVAQWKAMYLAKIEKGDEISDNIYIKTDYKLMQIRLSEILYIEGQKDYCKIFIEGNPNPIISLINLKILESKLPTKMFMRVHRSFIINLFKAKLIDRSRIVFGEEYIPISESYKHQFYDYVKDHLIALNHSIKLD